MSLVSRRMQARRSGDVGARGRPGSGRGPERPSGPAHPMRRARRLRRCGAWAKSPVPVRRPSAASDNRPPRPGPKGAIAEGARRLAGSSGGAGIRTAAIPLAWPSSRNGRNDANVSGQQSVGWHGATASVLSQIRASVSAAGSLTRMPFDADAIAFTTPTPWRCWCSSWHLWRTQAGPAELDCEANQGPSDWRASMCSKAVVVWDL